TVITALIFNFFSNIRMHHAFFGMIFLFVFQLANSGLLTTLLTHGLILLIFTGFLMLRAKTLKGG
ncbi:MAG: hypothetical protein ABIJ16_12230, partial [Bacteroidota bacterium]